MTRSAVPMEQAVQAIRPTDTLAVPLGPGVPGAFLHALGERTDFIDLRVSGALLPDLFALFMQPTVHLQSGFFGPAERFLRDSGADVDFVPADFRRFTHIVALDEDNLANLRRLSPADASAKLSLLLDHVDGREGQPVADPYFGDDDGFDLTWADVTAGARGLAQKLRRGD